MGRANVYSEARRAVGETVTAAGRESAVQPLARRLAQAHLEHEWAEARPTMITSPAL
jgi:hypothetical protein